MWIEPDFFSKVHSEIARLESGEYLFRPGQEDAFFQVISGAIKLGRRRPLPRGRFRHDEHVVQLVAAGEFIGWERLLHPSDEYAQAAAPSEIRVFPRFVLENTVKSAPTLVRALLLESARENLRWRHRADEFHLASVEQKVARVLLDLADRFGDDTVDGRRIDLALTRQEWAGLAQTIHESFTRCLSHFQKNGWLRIEKRALVLQDIPALRARGR